MPRFAQLADGTKLEFPDDTPDEVINKTALRVTQDRSPKVELSAEVIKIPGTKYKAFVPPDNVREAVMWAESRGNASAVSPVGALGTMQTMPDTLRDPGYGVMPEQATSTSEDRDRERERLGTHYLGAMINKFGGNLDYALAAYNWGPGATKKWISNGAVYANLPKETQNYIGKIKSRLDTVKPEPTQPTQKVNQSAPIEEGLSIAEQSDKGMLQDGIDVAANLGKGLVGESISLLGLVAGFPEWALSTLYKTTVQPLGSALGTGAAMLASGDTSGDIIDWTENKKEAERIFSPLAAPVKAVETLGKTAEQLGISVPQSETAVSRGMAIFANKVNQGAEFVEREYGIPTEATTAYIDLLLLTGIPGAKFARNKLINTIAPDAVTSPRTPIVSLPDPIKSTTEAKPLVKTSGEDILSNIDTPQLKNLKYEVATAKKVDDAFYISDNLEKLDANEGVNLDKRLKELGVDLETQQKFVRFDEGFAKGMELIPDTVKNIQKRIRKERVTQANLFKEGDLNTVINPQGKTSWADFPFKNEIKTSYNNLKVLEKERQSAFASLKNKEVLTPDEMKVYNDYYLPIKEQIDSVSRELSDRGLIPEYGIDTGFASRKLVATKKEQSILGTYKEAIIGKDWIDSKLDPMNTAEGGKARDLFVLENPSNGLREVVSIKENKKNKSIVFHERWGRPDQIINVPRELDTKSGATILGKKIREATLAELEKVTGKTYTKNYNLVLSDRLAGLEAQLRRHTIAENLAADPNIGWKPQTAFEQIPEGYAKLSYTQKTPNLDGVYFPQRVKEVLDDYNKPYDLNAVGVVNNALVTNMMMIPIVHMMNEGFHWGITRGASGFVNPAKLAKMVPQMIEAYKDVKNRGPITQEILRSGGANLSANVRNTMYLDKAFRENLNIAAKSLEFKAIAKAIAISPAKLYQNVSKLSNKSMWTVRDILVTQVVMEKMKQGKTMQEAIRSTERHMPNYRLPSRLVSDSKTGRLLSKMLGDRNFFLFSRYHAGMLSSGKNVIMDILGKNPELSKKESFKEGIDSGIATAIALAVVYPIMDEIMDRVAETFGINSAETHMRRPGVAHVIDTAIDISKGKKDQQAVAALLLTPSPVVQTAAELAYNMEFYNRRPIRNTVDEVEDQVSDTTSYLSRKIPMVGQYQQFSKEGGTGIGGFIFRNFLDTKLKTRDQVYQTEDQVERLRSQAEDNNYED